MPGIPENNVSENGGPCISTAPSQGAYWRGGACAHMEAGCRA